jgi:hypothetical protein
MNISGGKVVAIGAIAGALVSVLVLGDKIESWAYRPAFRYELQRVVDTNAEKLQQIDARLLEQSIEAATRELIDYQIKAKDDPDPLIAKRIKQLEDGIEAMQGELKGLK